MRKHRRSIIITVREVNFWFFMAVLLALSMVAPFAHAQANQPARRVISGTNLPATCLSSVLVRDVFYKTGSGAGLYICVSNAWVQQSSSGAAMSVPMGGTGQTSLTLNNVLLGNGTSAVQFVAPGTSGNVLTSNGTTWTSAAAAGGSLTSQTLTAGDLTVASNAVRAVTASVFTFSRAQVAALGAVTAGTLTVCTLPAKTVVLNVYLIVNQSELDLSALTVSVGRTAATYIDYIVASDAKAAANTIYGNEVAERGTNATGYDLASWTTTTAVLVRFDATAQNLGDGTGVAGTVVVEHYTIP